MSEKYFEDQLDDEEVLLVFRKHPLVMRKGIILAMIGVLGGSLPSLVKPEYSVFFGGVAIGTVVGLILLLPSWVSWYFSVFIVTDHRLIQITQKGLFHRSVVDMRLNQIQMVNYQIAGFQETLLGSGTIMMQTFVGDLIIRNVYHPAKIQKSILEILRDEGINPNAYPMTQELETTREEIGESEET